MRLQAIAPPELSHEQRPLYQSMRGSIGESLKGFTAINKKGAFYCALEPVGA